MIKIKTDLHTHTIFSMHAYSTIEENARHAAQEGLEVLGTTDHYSALFYPSTDWAWFGHFSNYKKALPPKWDGVKLLFGAEVDIVGLNGELFGEDIPCRFMENGRIPSMNESMFPKLDYIIASVHASDFASGASLAQTTNMYCKVLEHDRVMVIGHPGRAGVPFDVDEVLTCAKERGKMIEINNASFYNGPEVHKRCRDIAERCAELGVSIAVNSDAHSAYYVGKYEDTYKMLDEIHFPEELIGNRDMDSLSIFLERVRA